jgi:uncharacterized protein (DUF433 family)
MPRANPKPDLRAIATYGIPEAAHYLGVSEETLRSWVLGRKYPTARGIKTAKPIIILPDARKELLSFYNLVEAHVLLFARQVHGLQLQDVRNGIEYVRDHMKVERPLINQVFWTNGKHLFVKNLEQVINASKMGQLGIGVILDLYLQRIDWDAEGIARRLYPVRATSHEQRRIVIDPSISFGRPIVAGTGIPASVLFHRKRLGESEEDISKDYGIDKLAVEEAISYYKAA